MKQKTNYLLPLTIIGLFFFFIDFALGINFYLMPVLEKSTHISGAVSSLLLIATFILPLLFGIPATYYTKAIGYKRAMALSFAIFAAAFGPFVPTAKQNSLTWLLTVSFVSGAANAVLQASVDPYATTLGPMDSATRRISCMGISNKLAWLVITLSIILVIGKGIDDTQLIDLYMSFTIITGIFLLLGVIALMAPLPDVKAAGEDESESGDETAVSSYAGGETSILQFLHSLLDCLALFLHAGVETTSFATATGYVKSLGLEGSNYGFIPSVGTTAGYICGVIFIPRYLSQAAAMCICVIVALVGSVAVAVVPDPVISVYCIFLMALGCSPMWPVLWPLAVADLGKFAKSGVSLLIMAIADGAVMPWLRGAVQDATPFQTSYWVSVLCFLFVLYYGLAGYKIRTKKEER